MSRRTAVGRKRGWAHINIATLPRVARGQSRTAGVTNSRSEGSTRSEAVTAKNIITAVSRPYEAKNGIGARAMNENPAYNNQAGKIVAQVIVFDPETP